MVGGGVLGVLLGVVVLLWWWWSWGYIVMLTLSCLVMLNFGSIAMMLVSLKSIMPHGMVAILMRVLRPCPCRCTRP